MKNSWISPLVLMSSVVVSSFALWGQTETANKLVSTRNELIQMETSLKVAKGREEAMRQLNSRLIELQEELESTKTTVVEFSKDGAVVSEKIPTGSTVHIISADSKLIAVRVAHGAEETEINAQ